jgi:hypothetical protein
METAVGVDWDELLREEMGWAMRQKRNVIGDEQFTMRVKAIGPGGQIAKLPIVWRNEDEKRRAMWAVSRVAKDTLSQAVMVTSDARFLNTTGFCKRFGIAEPTVATLEEFNRERFRVMKGFDDYMGNLPNDCYYENLIVAIRGPQVCRMASTRYALVNGALVFEPMDDNKNATTLRMDLIPAWWN